MSITAAALCIPGQAKAAQVIATITGTVIVGAVSNSSPVSVPVFGFPPGTDLAGKSYRLVYTIDDTIGCKCDPGGGYSFIEDSGPSSECPGTNAKPGNPVTSAVLTIGHGSVSFGNHSYSVINGSNAYRVANDAAQFSIAESYNGSNNGGNGDVYANIYFVNPCLSG